jgi:hypothetical protein
MIAADPAEIVRHTVFGNALLSSEEVLKVLE